MRAPHNRNARWAPGVGKETAVERWKPASDSHSPDAGQSRSARRQRLVRYLHQAGPRPVLEALIAVAQGQDLDEVLADFARVPVATYRAVGADVLPITYLRVIGVRR